MSKPTRGTFACSFCGKQQARVQRLIAGPGPIFICDECVRLCTEIIAEEPRTPGWSPPSHTVGPRKIVPELYCSDFPRSLRFYTEVLGFRVRYTRREERFAYLDLDGAELMLEQTVDPARTFVAGALDYPFGRGMNLEIAVNDADAVYARAQAAGAAIFLPLEERWYRRDADEVGNRQFVVMDPDGYLLRFAQGLGARSIVATSTGGEPLTPV